MTPAILILLALLGGGEPPPQGPPVRPDATPLYLANPLALVKPRRVLFFTADWCPPCQPLKTNLLPQLRIAGWEIDGTPGADLQIVDLTTESQRQANADLVERYDVKTIPRLVLTREDREYLIVPNLQSQTPASLDALRRSFWK